MPISYEGISGAPDYLGMISNVNAVSPQQPSSPTNAATGGIGYGLSPDELKSGFTDAFSQAQSGYSPFPGDTSKIEQLQGVFNQVPQAYDVSGTLDSMSKARQRNLNVGQNSANSSAQSYLNSQVPGGQNLVGANIIRGQSLLPYLKQDSADAVTQGQYGDNAKQSALSQSAAIAKQLADLQNTYTNTLATYNSNRSNFALDYANKLSSLSLDSSYKNQNSLLDLYKTQATIAENAREANLSNALSNRSLDLTAAQTANSQQIQADTSYLQNVKAPSGYWETDNTGRVTSGQGSYNAYNAYNTSRARTAANLASLG